MREVQGPVPAAGEARPGNTPFLERFARGVSGVAAGLTAGGHVSRHAVAPALARGEPGRSPTRPTRRTAHRPRGGAGIHLVIRSIAVDHDLRPRTDLGVERRARVMRHTARSPWLAGLVLASIGSVVPAQTPPQDIAANLAATSWQLVKFQGSDDTTLTPDDGAKYTIAFETGGRVSVRIDCNRGRGTWTSAGPSQLQFGPLALTRAACPPGSLHDRLARDWVRAFLRDQGWPSFSCVDGRRRDLRVRASRPDETGTADVTGPIDRPDSVRMCADRWQRHVERHVLPDHAGDGARRARESDTPGIPGTHRERREVRGSGSPVLGCPRRGTGVLVGRRALVQATLIRRVRHLGS